MAYGGHAGAEDDGYLGEGYARVLGRRVPWSRWWRPAALLLALALVLSVLPVPFPGWRRVGCGTGPFLTHWWHGRDTYCGDLAADRFVRVVTLLVLAGVLGGFGQWERSRTRSGTNGWLTVLAVLVLAGLWLVLWPTGTPAGGSCGSPLLTWQGSVEDRATAAGCARARSERSARLGLVVLVALPVAVAAARSDHHV